MIKIEWQWPAAAVYCVTCLTLGILVFEGKVPPAAMAALVTWLVPAPWQARPKAPLEPPPEAH